MRFGMIGLVIVMASPAGATVKSVTPQGFIVASTATVSVPPLVAYAAVIQPARWWNKAHSWSGDAANLTLDARPGGCFCEKLPKNGGQVEHMRVINVQPGQLLRLRGALGPLQGEGAEGTLSWALKAAGIGTEISLTYAVGGYISAGPEVMAAPVDQVMSEQLMRLKAYLEQPASSGASPKMR